MTTTMTASSTARPPMRARNVWLALVAAVVGVSVFVVLLLIDDVRHGNGLTRYDWRVLHAFRRHRSPRLVDLSHVLAGLGNIETLVVVALIAGGLLWWRGLRPVLCFTPIASLLLTGAFVEALKVLLARAGPADTFRFGVAHATGAFPSGHSADTTAVAVSVAVLLAVVLARRVVVRVALVLAALGLSVAVGLSRLVLGVHWPTDVAAGWAVGLGCALVVATLALLATEGRPFAGPRDRRVSPEAV